MYYPKSQIQTNLYTNGGELMTRLGKREYIGYYYEVSDGKKYAGRNPNDQIPIELIPMSSQDGLEDEDSLLNPPIIYRPNNDSGQNFISPNSLKINESYRNLTNIGNTRFPPRFSLTIPTLEESQIGEYRRYFAKKTNELVYIEVSKETYNKFINEDPKVAFDLYNLVSLSWSLRGEERQVFETNKKIVELIEKENNWYGFTLYFKDNFLKYYISTKENLFTSGGEYTTKDGKEYIGDYHIHPDKGPMVGAVHVPYPHDYLFPISPPTGSVEQPSTPSITPVTPSYSPPTMGGGGGGY